MLTPFPYQQESIDAGIDHNILIADQPGLGKSLTAIEIGKEIMRRERYPNLVICPKLSRQQWVDYIHDQEGGSAIIIDRPLAHPLRGERFWAVTHYEGLRYLKPSYYAAIILDEAHAITNYRTKRAKMINALTGARKIAITGTYADRNTVAELWSIMHWLQPQRFNFHNRQVFLDWYGIPKTIRTKQGERKIYLPGTRDPLGLANEVKGLVFQRTREEVAPWISNWPPRVVVLDMYPDQQREYNLIAQSEDVVVGDYFIENELTRINLLQRVTSYMPSLPSIKLDWVNEYVEGHPNEKILILTRYVETAVALADRLGAPSFTGKTTDELMARIKDQDVIIGTIDKVGQSISLGAFSTTIYVDQHWSSRMMIQSEARTKRLDTSDPKYTIHLICHDSIDGYIRKGTDLKLSQNDIVRQYITALKERQSITDQ